MCHCCRPKWSQLGVLIPLDFSLPFFSISSFHLSFYPNFPSLILKWQGPRTLFLSGFQEDDTGLLSKLKVTPPPKKATVEAKPPPATQPSKPKSGGGLFSDEDEEEGGGLFGAPAVKPQLPKVETKSKPKAKTTISLFDDDEQDDEDEDFFSAPASTKANRYHRNVFNFYVTKCSLKNETTLARQQSVGICGALVILRCFHWHHFAFTCSRF